jgi:HPt (histidine-containing phosphotransfer) domain-containing protein
MSDPLVDAVIAGAVVLDRDALARLERIGGPTLLRRMVDIFLQDAVVRVDTILHSPHAADVMRAAHTMRSSAGNLGLDQVFRLTEAIEARAAAGDEPGYAPLRAALADAHVRAIAALEREVQRVAPPTAEEP